MLFVNYYKDSSSNVAAKHIFLECKLFWCVVECLQFCILKASCFVFFFNRRNKIEESQTGST